MFPLLMYVATSPKPILSKLSLRELMRIMCLPPTLTPRRRATNILTGGFNSLRIVKGTRRRAARAAREMDSQEGRRVGGRVHAFVRRGPVSAYYSTLFASES